VPKPSALALNQPIVMQMVRLKIVARQNHPFSELTAGKIDRPIHLVSQIYPRCMAMQVLSTQDAVLVRLVEHIIARQVIDHTSALKHADLQLRSDGRVFQASCRHIVRVGKMLVSGVRKDRLHPMRLPLFFHSRVDRDPIYFPSLAAVC
jgi:hypothetical protein